MRNSLSYLVLAASLAFAGPVLAQTPSPSPDKAPSTSAPPTAAGPDAAANVGASLQTGMSVKDKTGALIGEISDLKAGVATIKMGADVFTVDSNKLAVEGGAATINATQADLKKMLPKK
jgi:hypothetical protein